MHAELLERTALPLIWQALITEEGEPFAAFVRGHVNPFTLAGDAEDYIVATAGQRRAFPVTGVRFQ